ncbi:conjugative transfer signal peptidase TraF [Francisella philomiragia]|uniref:conjugative transfer signal peptidase TraF n=1 Tax=Francisella philomiragia TaxID=28110 RepID=UPI00190635A4|nr:conjugative transfer signal peptidase TraF [Francisella philomiragia]MBK2270175.1 conjugative transfer signal peptidase TraF [Francisella philomiragia]MBK2275839.1 conjugative transfer signal peptidase TraF [Francisella philomiragia]MBK2305052.1 conjugative transfer signal peptidase TraF [Francisella philomiragia]
MKRQFIIFSIIFGFLFILYVGFLGLYKIGYRFNVTSSLPIGIYKLEKTDKFTKGDIVEFCLPDNIAQYGRARGYIFGNRCGNNTLPFAKKILAVPNDYVVVNKKGVSVNGVFYSYPQINLDSNNQPVHKYIYQGKIDGYFMIGTNNPKSWDSRYFGVIPKERIKGTLHEVFVF